MLLKPILCASESFRLCVLNVVLQHNITVYPYQGHRMLEPIPADIGRPSQG